MGMRSIGLAAACAALLAAGAACAGGFSGGGGAIDFGVGSTDAIQQGLVGFYQGDRYRLGGALKAYGWGVDGLPDPFVDDGLWDVQAAVIGLYGTYTLRHDRMLLNVGGFAGAGRSSFSTALGGPWLGENVATFCIEPLLSVGVAAFRWMALEFQLSAPIFLLTEDLTLRYNNALYQMSSSDMTGVHFVTRMTFGKLADY